MENRVSKRYDLNGLVTCCYFNGPNQYIGALINYSKRGMCFETNGPLIERTTVLIRLQPDLRGKIDPETLEGLRTISMAEVKWCREFPDDEKRCYEIGIQYY